ncbi:MAG: hypothetical protein WC623_24545 [Pedobacter sp.]|uniref:hypothetical protein n=1 Tax=Pedobacter sp. TaxID=1411316 RepID=UPI003561C538
MSKARQKILSIISSSIGFRVSNIQRGTASEADKRLVSEALGFRSLCLYSVLEDKDLKQLWFDSNLEFSL